MFKSNYVVMLGSVILVTTQLTSSIASGPSGYPGSPSYGGYNQHQQQVQQQQHNPQQQQQDQWYSEASYQKESTTSQEEAATASTAATSEPTAGEEVILTPLPEGWSEHYDPNSGQYYYYNAADGTTSWDKPPPPGVVERGIVEGENKEEDSRPSIPAGNSPEYEQFNSNNGNTNLIENTTPEKQQLAHDVTEESNVISTTGEMVNSSPGADKWQLNHSSELKQLGVDESIILQQQQQQQEKNWESQRQSDHPQSTEWNPQMKLTGADENNGSQYKQENRGNLGQIDHAEVLKWGSSSPSIEKQTEGNKWDQSNSTIPPGDGGEHQEQIQQYQVQPAHTNQQQQQNEQPGVWGLSQTRKDEDRSSQSEPWGVTKSTEHRPQEQPHLPKQQPALFPDPDIQAPANGFSSDQSSTQGKWGIPKVTTGMTQPPPGDKPQSNDSSLPQKQPWQQQQQQQHNIQGNHQSSEPQRRSPVQQGHPQQNTQQQYQPTQPPYLQRQQQQHPLRYNPNTPPGHGQYDQPYGGQNNYGRGYPMQQPPQPQQSSSGKVISQGVDGTSAVKEAFSSTWKGLLGFGNKTREAVGTAREQVVTGATSAGQTLSAKSSSIWETAKSSVGGVFESNDDPSSQQGYSLSGHNQQSQPGNNRPPPGYPGRPIELDGRGPSSGYPNNSAANYGGRGAPPRNLGPPQNPNGPSFGQQPPYGMQPRRDPPYPQPSSQGVGQRGPIQTQYGRQTGPQPNNNQGGGQRGPIQTQYGRQAGPQPNNNQGGGQRGPTQTQYARQTGPQSNNQGGGQRRPPFPGSQLNRGTGQQSPPQQKHGQQGPPKQKQQPDPWDHPGLMGEN